MMATNLAYKMVQEGHDVKLFIDDEERKEGFDNLVPKTTDWRAELGWVGKGDDSLIVFDDIGYGIEQDKLRAEGYSVFGGSELADKLESDRQYAQEIFAQCGIKTVPTVDFNGIDEAISFLKEHKGAWVIKQNGDAPKMLNYVSNFEDGRDLINVLENYKTNLEDEMGTITLQEKIEGIEIAVARYFNGNDWVGPIELNIEHKKLFPDDIGPATSEMGTVGWYIDGENNKIFTETLAKLKPYLKEIKYKGAIDLNCIANKSGVYPLEATPRFGSPIIYLQIELHTSPWGELLKAIADGKEYSLQWKRGYGVVVVVVAPPFPYQKKIQSISPKNLNVYFDNITKDDFTHICFEGVAFNNINKQYYISDHQGYVLYVTSVDTDIALAQERVYKIIENIYFAKMFFRNDIGSNFMEGDHEKLHGWGYI